MPEIQLNGKTIATQTGTNEPVLKNNVVMESGFSIPSGVINSALSGATFPAGHVIQVVQTTPYTSATVNSTTPTAIAGGNITILQNSKIFALSTGNGNPTNAGDWNFVGLYLDTTSFGQEIIFQSAGASYNHAWAVQAITDNLSSGTYTIYTKAYQGSGTMNYREVGSVAPALFLFEIAG